MKCSEIRSILGDRLEVRGGGDPDIRYLLTDSRELSALSCQPSEVLFFAIKTEKNDGAKYIPDLEAKGVKAFVTGDALGALQALAAYVREQFKGTVIGITGSNGPKALRSGLTPPY